MCALIRCNRCFHRRPRRYQTGSATREFDTRKTSASSRRRPTCTRRGPRSAPPTCRLTAARQTLLPLPTQPVSSECRPSGHWEGSRGALHVRKGNCEQSKIMTVDFQNKSMNGSVPKRNDSKYTLEQSPTGMRASAYITAYYL